MKRGQRQIHFLVCLIPIVFLLSMLIINVQLFEDPMAGANQIILIFTAVLAGLIGLIYKVTWQDIMKGIKNSLGKALPAILILFFIGSLAGTWLISGVVPAMIFYGLKLIHPKIFLLSAIIVSGIVSIATGSSWSTIATVGVALLGIGKAMGFNEGLVAGAIISGAYFGDKMSPLSDTTNLAPAIAGTDLFTHIRYMSITTIPSVTLAVLIFAVLGFVLPVNETETNINELLITIESKFYISPVLFIVPLALISIIVSKVPALPSLLAGIFLGLIFALIFQQGIIHELSSNNSKETGSYFINAYKISLLSVFGEIQINSDNVLVERLFKTTGMSGMLYTVWLILSAMIFGGTMQAVGMLKRISLQIIKIARSTGSVVASTIATSVFFNITASDQYISIVVPGEMFSDYYRLKGYRPELLSRTLEDGGTLTSVLIPWNTCGATQSKVLGVSVIEFAPFCFFNLINPIMAIIIAFMGYKIRKISPDGND